MSRTSSAFGRKSAALIVAALGTVGGCAAAPHASPATHGTSSSHPAHSSRRGTRIAHGAGALNATQSLALASRNTSRVSSLALTESVTLHGLPAVAGVTSSGIGAMRLSLREQMRLRPTLLAHLTMRMNAAGKAVSLEEILTSRALYLGRQASRLRLASLGPRSACRRCRTA